VLNRHHFMTTGLAAGGVWGLREGLRRPAAPKMATSSGTAAPLLNATSPIAPLGASTVGAQATSFAKGAAAEATKSGPEAAAEKAKLNAANAARVSSRLRWNNVLNQVTRRGSFTGNSAGVLGKST
jgi:import inner membrane translocase subunit TIM23